MNTKILLSLIALVAIPTANAQTIRDGINEDQVIICVNGHVVNLSGNICKVFGADGSVSDYQQELYKYPHMDTFDMEVLD